MNQVFANLCGALNEHDVTGRLLPRMAQDVYLFTGGGYLPGIVLNDIAWPTEDRMQ